MILVMGKQGSFWPFRVSSVVHNFVRCLFQQSTNANYIKVRLGSARGVQVLVKGGVA